MALLLEPQQLACPSLLSRSVESQVVWLPAQQMCISSAAVEAVRPGLGQVSALPVERTAPSARTSLVGLHAKQWWSVFGSDGAFTSVFGRYSAEDVVDPVFSSCISYRILLNRLTVMFINVILECLFRLV